MTLSNNPIARYLRRSRNLANSLVLVLPLLVLYQVGVLTTGGMRNGADFATAAMWWAAGGELSYYLGINAGILAIFALVAFALRHRGTFRSGLWPAVVLESGVYALFFGTVVLQIMALIGVDPTLSAGPGGDSILSAIVLSLGAGIYEELVFRLLVLGGLYVAGTRLLRWPAAASAVVAVALSSLAFSAMHHVGTLGEAFVPGVFVFRFVAGALLAAIFVLRGFAVAVYTHAIYDMIVMLSPG